MDSFLINYAKDTTIQTHISMNGGKYNIPDKDIEIFHKKYYNCIKKKEVLYLVEKITDINFSFFVDIDDKVKDKDNENELTDEFIVELLESFDKCIKEWFTSTNTLNVCVVSKRDNKYHINYPNLIVNSHIANKIISFINCKNIDKSVYRTGLRMIGSQKLNEASNQKYYRIYDINTKEYKELKFKTFLDTIIRKPNSKLSELSEYGQKIISSVSTTFNYENENSEAETENGGVKLKKELNQKIDVGILLEIEQLLNHLKNTNTDIKEFKMTINRVYAKQNSMGLFCYYLQLNEKMCPFKHSEHARDTSPIYIELNYTKMSIKCHDEDHTGQVYPENGIILPKELEKKFPKLFKSMSIKYYKSDLNLSDDMKQQLENSLSGTHYKVSEVIFNIYHNKFSIDDIKNTTWYEFNGVRWEESYSINILISKEIPMYYKSIKIINPISTDVDADNKKLIKNKMIDNIIVNLENVVYKTNIISQLKFLFKNDNPKFYNKLDENPYLIGFNNGVYDFKLNKFRNGLQKDCLTFSTGYDYQEYNESDIFIKEIYTFLSNIITNKKVYEYLLKILGKSLVGCPDEKFYIMTGICGANGKSTLINLLENTLGDYMTSVDTSLLVNKRGSSSGVSPDVVRLRGKRLLSFQEPEHNDKLRTGILKQFTGGDTITARDLFKSPITFKLQGTMVMCCNDLPSIPSSDGGTWRRLRVIDFNSRFLDNPNPKHANEFKKDPCLKSKLKLWKPYFMSILIHWYNKQLSEGIIEPSEVLQSTEKYREDNNKFTNFINECISESIEDNFQSISNIYSVFCQWWQEKYTNSNTKFHIPPEKELIKAFKFKFGPLIEHKNGKIIETGYNIKINYDDNCTLQDDDE